MSKWKTIESAPKDGTLILAFGKGVDGFRWPVGQEMPSQVAVAQWRELRLADEEFRGFWRSHLSWFKPTHWMPLPAPPSEDTGG